MNNESKREIKNILHNEKIVYCDKCKKEIDSTSMCYKPIYRKDFSVCLSCFKEFYQKPLKIIKEVIKNGYN